MSGMRQKRRRLLIAIILVALIGCVAAGIVVRKVMVVRNIVIEGVDDELADQARTLAGIRLGQSIFTIDERQIAINLRENGYINLCSVEIQRPDTVVLKLEKRKKIALFEHLGFTYIVDSQLYVLECTGTQGDSDLMRITGASIQRTPVGMALNIDASQGKLLKTILGAVENVGIEDVISEINVASERNLYLIARAGFTFKLGDTSDLDTKLAWIEPMIKQLGKEGRSSGTVDVSSVSSADYMPPAATPVATVQPGQPTPTFRPYSATEAPTQSA